MPENAAGILLFWDFYGPEAERIAGHFLVHLKEFLAKHDVDVPTQVRKLTDNHWAVSCDPGDLPHFLTEKSTQQEGSDDDESHEAERASLADRLGKALRPQRFEWKTQL